MKKNGNKHRQFSSRALAFLLSFVMVVSTFIGDYTMANAGENIPAGAETVQESNEASSEAASEASSSQANSEEGTKAGTETSKSTTEASTAASTTETASETTTEATVETTTEATETSVVIKFSATEGGSVSAAEQSLGEKDTVQAVTAIAD